VVVLDLTLPDLDGLEVCRRLREGSDVPIVMLTARGEPTDRVVGLELGADDYLGKPFDPRELVARLRAVLRRRAPRPGGVLRFGRLEIHPEAREVRLDGTVRPLTSHQFDLLLALAQSAGRALSREALMERVRGLGVEAFDRSIDVHVSRIRAAIEDDPRRPKRILTLRGAGYLFARDPDGDGGR
jgi:DNA-binding response OmpR family regulator